jgi:putative GTP pyrophosphokinase
MQDLVGFRVVVPRAIDQERLVALVPRDSSVRITDRRQQPSYGYRAVHIVRRDETGVVEAQIRTRLQHRWAELSEHFDRAFPGTKYGAGPPEVRQLLDSTSQIIAEVEDLELRTTMTLEQLHQGMVDLLDSAIEAAPKGARS